jgi:precorrin-2 dehydrogenase / sirohydrochlorin ferrochelatase
MTDPVESPPGPTPDRAVSEYQVALILTGHRCLVVGGGGVATRRAHGLVAAGGEVTVVAPEVSEGITGLAGGDGDGSGHDLPGSLVVRSRPYRPGEAAGYQLVLTATGQPDVDRQVVADATAAGVLVNGADGTAPGTVRLPAVHREGPVTVAVSTGGSSPALARWLRDRMVAAIPDGAASVAGLIEEARAELRRRGRPTDSVAWEPLLEELVPLAAAGRLDEARAALARACGLPPPVPPARPSVR